MATSTTATTSASGAAFNFSGAISGLDTTSIISAMLAAEKAPLTVISNQRALLQARQTAYNSLSTQLTTLQSALKALTTGSSASARMATSSNTTVLGATASSGAMAGTYLVQVNHLATSTRATSSGALGTAITAADLGTTMANLPLAGTVTAGSLGVVVDGKIVSATIGAAASTTLGDALDAIAGAIQAQIQATEGTSNATVTASIVDNKVQLSISGAATDHTLSFGVGGDSTSAGVVLGLSGISGATLSSASPITGTQSLGVVRTSTVLDNAGLTGLTGTTTGVLTVNGAAISYDTTVDTLSSIVTKINASSAGVTASLDRANDHLVLTSKSGGASAINIVDTSGTLGGALKLEPGSTSNQLLGSQASVTVDGTTYLSNSNTVTNAISGVKLSLQTLGTSSVAVAADTKTTTTAVQAVVDAFNALANSLDTMTSNVQGGTKGPLASEFGTRDVAMSLRGLLTAAVSGSSIFKSLADIGVTTGRVGAAKGTTNRLQLDGDKLAAALDTNSGGVADLLTSIMGPTIKAVDVWTKFGGRISTAQNDITSQLKELDDREVQVNERVALREAALQAKFATMEKLLAQMQTTTNSLSNSIAQQNKSTG